ncbi:MAG: DAK2 domain-containing protein [Eubacteriales bacterium]
MKSIITAQDFQNMVCHGTAKLSGETQMLNDLNVFPVPDGDTGTNMTLTMSAASKEMENGEFETLGEASQKTASALLRGARGNSGVILSLLFRGFAQGTKDWVTVDGRTFALAMDFGVAAAYKAVMKPAEGTILTVSRMAAAGAAGKAREDNTVEAVLSAAIEAGEIALAETIHQNPVLEKAGVVDAGGKGFLIVLQGMLDSIQGKPMPKVEKTQESSGADFGNFDVGDIKFGYCTEFICARETKKDPEILRSRLDEMGDSLVLVEDDEIIKVHVHTNNPGVALEEGLKYGQLLKVKIENMREQHTEIINKEEETPKPAKPTKKFGFVSICAGEGLENLFRDFAVDGIISGGQTMNPSTEDILREINKTPAEIVYVLPNNKNIIMAAQQCVPLFQEKQVIVIPTKSVPQGLSAMMMVDPEGTEEYNTREMTAAMEAVTTAEITYAARNSDFDGNEIKEGDYLGLLENQFFYTGASFETLVQELLAQEKFQEAEFLTVYVGEEAIEEQSERLQEIIAETLPEADVTVHQGKQPVYYYIISAE